MGIRIMIPISCISEKVTVQIPLELLRHLPMRIATRWGRCPPTTTFSHGQRSECADLSELLPLQNLPSRKNFEIFLLFSHGYNKIDLRSGGKWNKVVDFGWKVAR